MSVAGGRRLSAFGCQNGCVGLALVNQSRPGEAPVTWGVNRCAGWTVGRRLVTMSVICLCNSVGYPPAVCPVGFFYIPSNRIIVSNYASGSLWVLVSVRRQTVLVVISLSWKGQLTQLILCTWTYFFPEITAVLQSQIYVTPLLTHLQCKVNGKWLLNRMGSLPICLGWWSC